MYMHLNSFYINIVVLPFNELVHAYHIYRIDEAFSTAARCQADLQIQRRKSALQEKQLMCHQGGILKLKSNDNNVADLENE